MAVSYVEEGHTRSEAARRFKVHPGTVSRWIKLKDTTYGLKPTSVPRSPYKSPLKPLERYAEKYLDAFLRKIAAHFGCGKDAVARALKKLEFKRKKNGKFIENGTNRRENVC